MLPLLRRATTLVKLHLDTMSRKATQYDIYRIFQLRGHMHTRTVPTAVLILSVTELGTKATHSVQYFPMIVVTTRFLGFWLGAIGWPLALLLANAKCLVIEPNAEQVKRFAIEPLRTALDVDDGSLDGWILHTSIHHYQVGYRNQVINHSKTTGVKGISVIEGNRLTIEAATKACLWHRRSSTRLCRR